MREDPMAMSGTSGPLASGARTAWLITVAATTTTTSTMNEYLGGKARAAAMAANPQNNENQISVLPVRCSPVHPNHHVATATM